MLETDVLTGSQDLYVLSDDRTRLDFDLVHRWLTSSDAYWMKGYTRDELERAFAASTVVVGVYRGEQQVGVGRIVSDGVTFAWMADAFVDAGHRGAGLGKRLVQWGAHWAEASGVRLSLLVTRDAQAVYATAGFRPLRDPSRWMAYYATPDRPGTPPA